MIEYTTADLIEDERLRFEHSFEVYFGWRKGSLHAMRDGDGYGDRLIVVMFWASWLMAVGLLLPSPKDRSNTHSIVDKHGQPLPRVD